MAIWLLGNDYQSLLKEIEELENEIKELETKLYNPHKTNYGIHVSCNTVKDKFAHNADALYSLNAKIRAKIDELKSLRLFIEDTIEQYPSESRRILRLRYIKKMSWNQVANRMFYDESTCRRIHRRLLEELNNKMM